MKEDEESQKDIGRGLARSHHCQGFTPTKIASPITTTHFFSLKTLLHNTCFKAGISQS